jgi:pimeloyl-ACP methyl ester carboxylesterase
MHDSIVDRFCTPPEFPETETDRNAFADAELEAFQFEDRHIQVYSWGTGQNVLLVHGWGSRASHLALLGRNLAKAGFRVTAFDGPAHGRSVQTGKPNRSNLFEFCRALSSIGRTFSPLHGIVGHSFGAAAAAFTAAGFSRLADFRIHTERIAMISSPAGVDRMVEHFCRRTGEEARLAELTHGLEQNFDFSIPEYSVTDALRTIQSRVLIVHDEQDEEVPVADAIRLKEALPDAEILLTQGAGHDKILGNRTMLRAVKDFLSAP